MKVDEEAFSKEECMAVCVIIHAAVEESLIFRMASVPKRKKVVEFKSKFFSDGGVMVGEVAGKITAKVYVIIETAGYFIYKEALELQQRIFKDVFELTGKEIAKVDVSILAIPAKKQPLPKRKDRAKD